MSGCHGRLLIDSKTYVNAIQVDIDDDDKLVKEDGKVNQYMTFVINSRCWQLSVVVMGGEGG